MVVEVNGKQSTTKNDLFVSVMQHCCAVIMVFLPCPASRSLATKRGCFRQLQSRSRRLELADARDPVLLLLP